MLPSLELENPMHAPGDGESDRGRTFAPTEVAGALAPFPRATTLPAEAFTSARVYAAEKRRIFEREWLCVARADQIPSPGDYLTLDLFDERLVIVRDEAGQIRALSRVCRHRAADVVTGSGNARSFQCPYHAWTYRLDGRLQGAPYMDEVEGFSRPDCRLPEIRSELWEGFVFVNLDPDAEPLAVRLAPLSKLLAGYHMAEKIAVETAVFDSPFNWKVLVDNFMEAYHHIATHKDTLQPIFPAARSWIPDNEGPYSALVMPTRDAPEDDTGTSELRVDRDPGRLIAAVVYPFHLIAPGHDALTWYQILPHAHDRFTLRIYSCFTPEALADEATADARRGLQAITETVHREDIGACEAVWSGLQSPSFTSGPLAPLEKAIWQFNRWWAERMTDPAGA